MSFRDCLTRAALRGAITQGKRDEALALLNDLERDLKASGVVDSMVSDQAAAKALEEIQRTALRKKQLAVLAHSAKQKVDAALTGYKDGKDFVNAAKSLIENDGLSAADSYAGKKRVYLGRYHAMLADFIEQYGKGIYSVIRHTDGLDDIGRELYGQSTGNKTAALLAKAVDSTRESMRVMANSLGADIGKLERYGLQQSHNTLKVAKEGRDGWVNKLLQNSLNGEGKLRIDFSKMRDKAGRPLTYLDNEEKRKLLGELWETIKTNGYVKQRTAQGQSALANRLGHERFLHFTSFEDWKAYNDEFGDGDVFTNVINQVEHGSQELAMLDVFGPNPTAMKQYIKDAAMHKAGVTDAAAKGPVKKLEHLAAQKGLREFEEMWSIATGSNGIVSNDRLGFTMAGIRNIITSAKLGASTLSAVPGDMVTVRMAKSISNLPGSKFMGQYVKNLAKSGERQLAIRLGLIAEAATSVAAGQYRYMGDIFGPAWTRKVSDTVLRLNGLTAHTQAARWAHGMEWLGYFADKSGKGFDDLEVKEALSRAGITAEDWNVFRKTEHYEHEGATFLRPDDLLTREDLQPLKAQGIADKFQMFVLDEMTRAVPEATLRARTKLVGESKPGTLSGELLRSFAMFKNFPVTLMMLYSRGIMTREGLKSKAAFAATYGLMLTAVGALTVQLQQLAKGRDPINMNPTTKFGRSFWGQAALTGGGLGIWGDFLFRDVNRFGGGLPETLAGPVAQFGADTAKLTVGNAIKLAQGQPTHISSDLLNYVRNNMPGSNLWYARLILQNGIMDAVQREVDPDAMSKWQRDQSNYYRDYGQKYWWRKGTPVPQRAPDILQAVGK